MDRIPGQGANASKNAQAAGAIGIIDIADNNSGGDPFGLTTSPVLTKPMVVCPTAYGNAIKAAAAFDANGVSTSTPSLNITIAPTNGFFARAGTATDTIASYSSRGPRPEDNAIKPDITAPAEVSVMALVRSGNGLVSEGGTSFSCPRVTGMMAILRQLHPTWTPEELMALAINTSTHNVTLGPLAGAGPVMGVGRVGPGRIDVTQASQASVIAYNAVNRGLINVSFGSVEVPVDSGTSLTKSITISNKGSADVTYNLSYLDMTPVNGADFIVNDGNPTTAVTVAAGSTVTFPVTFAANGSQLSHELEASVSTVTASVFGVNFPREWLTEKTGYAVLTPTGGSEPTIRVALYANPKPVSAMRALPQSIVPDSPAGQFSVTLTGAPIFTGSSFPFDIISFGKAFRTPVREHQCRSRLRTHRPSGD